MTAKSSPTPHGRRSLRRAAAKGPTQVNTLGSSTPSSEERVSKHRNASFGTSPLAHRVVCANTNNHAAYVSSPIKKSQLPSPSPDRGTSKSSPLSRRRGPPKKVMFAEGLIHNSLKPAAPTPRRPILKVGSAMSSPPVMLSLTQPTDSKKKLNPHLPEFWTPGNIPRLSESSILSDNLTGFKTLMSGGLAVLKMDECIRQFEIYATFNHLFKDLDDKRANSLIPLLPELLQLIKKDIVDIETVIFGQNQPNPFLTRTEVQITKATTALMSNPKLQQAWKLGTEHREFVSWKIRHSCSVITRHDVPKTLLTANLQFLKDQKAHALMSQGLQELLLDSVMRMKFMLSGSLTGEKLSTIKSLIIHSTPLMEKNVKVWLPYLLNCVCDFSSPMYLKIVGSSSTVMLEAAKSFMTSKAVSFEFKSSMESSIVKTLNIEPESQSSIGSSPLDLAQSTMIYLAGRLHDLVAQGNFKVALDIWLSVTLLVYNGLNSVKSPLSLDSPWYEVLRNCLLKGSNECKTQGLRTWRVLVYIVCNTLDRVEGDDFIRMTDLLFAVFDYEDSIPSASYSGHLSNIFSMICYALLNNPDLRDLSSIIIEDRLLPILRKFMSASDIPELAFYAARIFNHILSPTMTNKDYSLYLVKVMGTEPFDWREIKPLTPLAVFKNHSTLLGFLSNDIWPKNNITHKTKIATLSCLMSRIKSVLSMDLGYVDIAQMLEIIDVEYTSFLEMYAKRLDSINDPIARVEHVNRYVLLLKTTFGSMCVSRLNDKRETAYIIDNIYLSIVKETMKYPLVKIVEVLKFILIHIKTFKINFFESLATVINDKIINQFITNNLETLIFEKPLSDAEAMAFAHTIRVVPKSNALFKSFFIAISKTASPITHLHELQIKNWPSDDVFRLFKYVSRDFPAMKAIVLDIVSAKLQDKNAGFAIQMFDEVIDDVTDDALIRFKEHIYFHAIDYHSLYTPEEHTTLLELFMQYIDRASSLPDGEHESIITHGLTLTTSLLNMASADVELPMRVCKVLKVLLDHTTAVFRRPGLLMPAASKVIADLTEQKDELRIHLPESCVEVLGWTASLLDSSVGTKDTLPIGSTDESHPASLKDTLVIDDQAPGPVLDNAVVPESESSEIEHEKSQPELQVWSSDKSPDTSEDVGLTETQLILKSLKLIPLIPAFGRDDLSDLEPTRITETNLTNVFTETASNAGPAEGSSDLPTYITETTSSTLVVDHGSDLERTQMIQEESDLVEASSKETDDATSSSATEVTTYDSGSAATQEIDYTPKITKSSSIELIGTCAGMSDAIAVIDTTDAPQVTTDEGEGGEERAESSAAGDIDSSHHVPSVTAPRSFREKPEVIELSSDSEDGVEVVNNEIDSSPLKFARKYGSSVGDTLNTDTSSEDGQNHNGDHSTVPVNKRKIEDAELASPDKKHCSDDDSGASQDEGMTYSSPTPMARQLATTDAGSGLVALRQQAMLVPPPPPPQSAFTNIAAFIDNIDDTAISSLSNAECYEVESRMLQFMMRLRNRQPPQ